MTTPKKRPTTSNGPSRYRRHRDPTSTPTTTATTIANVVSSTVAGNRSLMISVTERGSVEGSAEVAADHAAQVVDVLLQDRVVEADASRARSMSACDARPPSDAATGSPGATRSRTNRTVRMTKRKRGASARRTSR